MPGWVERLEYAEAFHIAPQSVGQSPALWYQRWRLLRLARAARELETSKTGLDKMTEAQRELKRWTYGG